MRDMIQQMKEMLAPNPEFIPACEPTARLNLSVQTQVISLSRGPAETETSLLFTFYNLQDIQNMSDVYCGHARRKNCA
jgi:ABC-type dipeptide/oligopeptide/nickel transport system ATPase component